MYSFIFDHAWEWFLRILYKWKNIRKCYLVLKDICFICMFIKSKLASYSAFDLEIHRVNIVIDLSYKHLFIHLIQIYSRNVLFYSAFDLEMCGFWIYAMFHFLWLVLSWDYFFLFYHTFIMFFIWSDYFSLDLMCIKIWFYFITICRSYW